MVIRETRELLSSFAYLGWEGNGVPAVDCGGWDRDAGVVNSVGSRVGDANGDVTGGVSGGAFGVGEVGSAGGHRRLEGDRFVRSNDVSPRDVGAGDESEHGDGLVWWDVGGLEVRGS